VNVATKRARYFVTTWDTIAQDWTPQAGVRTGPYTLFGLRRAVRKLRGMGYEGRRDDPAVRVERIGWLADWLATRPPGFAARQPAAVQASLFPDGGEG
jgi:hypothetical protein